MSAGLVFARLAPVAFTVALLTGNARPIHGQPSVFKGAPAAVWIAHPDVPGDVFAVFHFRRSFNLTTTPSRFVVHLSADNRYRFYVNGQIVSSGPQRSDLMHWRYESVDLAPYLRAGRNTLGALVWNWGAYRPVAQFSRRSAFLLTGETKEEAVVNTGPEWKVFHDSGYRALPVSYDQVGGYYAAPPGESVDAAHFPWGWEQADFTDQHWVTPVRAGVGLDGIALAQASHPFGEAGGWQLAPRSIPMMEERPVRFQRVRRAEGIVADDAFLKGSGDLVVPARTRAVLLLDNAQLTNAYTVLSTSGGAGSTLTLTYAEALKDSAGHKGNRDAIEGKTISGVRDIFRFDGGAQRYFQTLWFRTYRYVQVEIQTAEEPLRVHDLHGVFTGFPLAERGKFASDLPWLADMWTMNWRVSRLCAWETYFDTPYYEQLQYIGDTRIQSLVSIYVAGDDRLVRQAIEHFDASRIPDGITASRYPSSLGQYIPTFSLIWVAMVHDYWMHRDDPAFVRRLLPGVRSVLGWYERQVDNTGLLGPMPWWNFIDWVDVWPRGVPPGADKGHSVMITLQFVYALERAAELEVALGQTAQGARYRSLASSLRTAARTRAWDQARGLFRDAPDTAAYSQHTNAMAVLVGAVPSVEQRSFMQRVLSDSSLTQASYYYDFYLFEAMYKAGLADQYIERLAPWKGMLALGLTTTAEKAEPTRSDSHAWSAHPNYGLLATVLGIRPSAPGFRSVRIAPNLGQLQRAEGRLPHPLGDIDVRVVRTGANGVRAEVTLPPGLAGVFEWRGRSTPLRPGRQEIIW